MFFEFLGRITAIRSFVGQEDGIHLSIHSVPSEESLRDILALFHRYRIPAMRQLAQFERKSNHDWFTDRNAYWHKKVFPSKIDKHENS